jgi:hypothetical protein|tara:strand:+ start:4514 stop:5170 length:657 start_codon:yes stop_codon:yes gene_type:complete
MISADSILSKAMKEIKDNEAALSMDFKGKNYLTVAARVGVARKHFGTRLTIKTYIIDRTANSVCMTCTVLIDGIEVATGYAEEIRSQGYINKTSALENCETSAIGRALGFLGLNNDTIATADEIVNAEATVKHLKIVGVKHTGELETPVQSDDEMYKTLITALKTASHAPGMKKIVSQSKYKEWLKRIKGDNDVMFKKFSNEYQETQKQLEKGKSTNE